MQKHERFEELAALAIIGQLSAEEHAALQVHLQSCSACRKAAHEFVDTVHHLPLEDSATADDEQLALQDAARAEHFLSRAQAEGVRFSKDALDAERSRVSVWRWLIAPKLTVSPALATVIVAVVAFGLLWGGSWRQDKIIVQRVPIPAAPKIEVPAPTDNGVLAELTRAQERIADLKQQINKLKAQVATSDSGLGIANSDVREQRALVAKLQERILQQESLVSQRTAESQDVKADRDKLIASLVADAAHVRDLEGELRNAQSAIEQERQLNGAARDVRELMGARKLHIIDVYDSDNHSATNRSFGRVIYTEGKSLIFYAFDLDKVHGIRKVSFQGWGEREGDHKDPTKLGVFYVDDAAQKRWVMKVSDPERLKAIDTVFITVESQVDTNSPSGQRVLQAYLGSKANHP